MRKFVLMVVAAIAISFSARSQGVTIRANALGWAAAIVNVGAEVAFNEHWTGLVEGYYSPVWNLDRFRLRGFMVTPEVRYYFCESFKWHYLGVHGNYSDFSKFQIGRMNIREGYAFAAGLTYGYTWRIGKSWYYDMFIGVGWWQIHGDIYHRFYPDVKIGQNSVENKVGVTRLGATFAYKF